MTDKVIEPQVGVDGIAVLGIDVAHVRGGQTRIELLRIVVSIKLESRAVIAPDQGVGVVLVGIHVDAIADIRVVVVILCDIADPEGVINFKGIILAPSARSSSLRFTLFIRVAGVISFRLELDGTVGLCFVGVGHVVQLDFEISGTLKATQTLVIGHGNLFDQLTIGIFVNTELEEIGIDNIVDRNVSNFATHVSQVHINRSSGANRIERQGRSAPQPEAGPSVADHIVTNFTIAVIRGIPSAGRERNYAKTQAKRECQHQRKDFFHW